MNDNNLIQDDTQKGFGRYQLLRRIGRGGMGDVWLCEDPRLRRQVAIKTLPPHSQRDQEFAMRFEREAQAAAALNHPHILPVHDYGKQVLPDGRVVTYIVMPYVAGGALADRINQLAEHQAGMAQREAVTYLMQAAEAIDYAHERGVIHRDIKPANMLLRDKDWLLLADFGIARILSESEQLTQTGTGIGTPEYMSPEQAQGRAEAASDNYSLAVIAYQLLTGRVPFSADSSYATTIQHLTMPPPPPRQFNPYLSHMCENVLLRGLAKQPAGRFPSARAFVEELQRGFTNTAYEVTFLKPPGLQPSTTNPAGSDHTALAVPHTNPSANLADTKGGHKLTGSTTDGANVTRRRVLLGGGAALVALGAGTGVWALATHHIPGLSQTNGTPITNTRPSPVPTADPNGPTMILREHNKPVYGLVWSPKGNVLVSAGDDQFVKLWQVQQQSTPLKSTFTQTINYSYAMRLAWSPDGTMLAMGSDTNTSKTNDAQVEVYKSDLSGPAPGYEQPIKVPAVGSSLIYGLGWMQGGKYIIVGINPSDPKNDNVFQLALWDTKAKVLLKPVLVPGLLNVGGTVSGIQAVVVSPDGTQVACALANNAIVGQLIVTGNQVKWQQHGNELKFADYSQTANAIAWSPDGQLVAAINDFPPTVLMAWTVKDNAQQPNMFKVPGRTTDLQTLAWSPAASNPLLAAGAKDGTVYVWDNRKGADPVRILSSGGIQKTTKALAWSADGQWLAASYDDTNASILVWKI